MAGKHVFKISSINEFFADNKMIKRGDNALDSNHVLQMQFDAELMILKGKVQASMKDKTYNVKICLNKSAEITDANCSCPRGIKCHHIAALALFGHYHISPTDKECTWNTPKASTSEVKTSEELYPSKEYAAVTHMLSDTEIDSLRTKLSLLGNTVGFSWLIQKPIEQKDFSYLPVIDEIVSSHEFVQASNKAAYLRQKCSLDDAAVEHIAELTIGQAQNELWLIMRKFRLTASNFGAVMNACQRNKFPESLFKSLMGACNLEGVKAIQWGRSNEKNGISYVESSLGIKIQQTGIWFSNSGILGASPDGFVGEDAIVEIKCPYIYRNDMLSKKLKNTTSYAIYFNENDGIVINCNHNYYHQIQGNLHLTKRQKCYLCIWTPKESIMVIVEVDASWAENISILEKFYDNHYFPRIQSE